MSTPPEGPWTQGDPQGEQPAGGWQPTGPPGPGPSYPSAPPYGYLPPPPEHPQSTTVMVLGILGLVMCQVASPFAWVMGKRSVAEIDASGGRLGGRGQAQTGYILGIVGTCLLGLGLVVLVFYFVFVVLVLGGMAASST